jgi:hypothetical protein
VGRAQADRAGAGEAVRHPGEWIHRRWHLQREEDESGRLGKFACWLWHGKVREGDFTLQPMPGQRHR